MYNKITFYLKTNLKKPSVDFEWTDEDNRKFFNFLEDDAPVHYLRSEDNLSAIQRAFKSYFEQVGYILFEIKNKKIKLKVIQYELEPEESEDIEDIIDIIDKYGESIINGHNGRSDQILLGKELRDKIFEHVETIDNHKINKKELLKAAVREAFELKESDIVLVKKDSIFIKLCDISTRHKLPSSQINTIANRYNGIDEKELKSFIEEHFSSGGNKEFFNLAARLFVDRYLLEKNINNEEYERNVFSYVQSIITEQLISKFDKCENFFKGLSGYILRRHFIEVFENIAEAILVELSLSNSYIVDFLKYYSLDVVVLNGKKHKVQAIETENGVKWNVVSMLSIVRVYVKTNADGKLLGHAIEKKEAEIAELMVSGHSPIEYNKLNNVEKDLLISELEDCEKKLDIYYDSKSLANTKDEIDSFEKDINLIKKEIEQIKKDKEGLQTRYTSMNDINKYLLLEKDINTMKNKLKKEVKVLGQNAKAFNSIKNGLIKALVSKKKLITK